jgi:VIT1/CCC1 family predicted Fe2+/Mn2+ transporter
MPEALQIALGALLVVGVLGGIAAGPFLLLGLIARHRAPDRPEIADRLLRRSAQVATGLGLITALYPVVAVLGGHAVTYGLWTLLTAGLLLIALGRVLARVRGA